MKAYAWWSVVLLLSCTNAFTLPSLSEVPETVSAWFGNFFWETTLVVYSLPSESSGGFPDAANYFLKEGVRLQPSIDYVLVIHESYEIEIPDLDNVAVVRTDLDSHDFSYWGLGLEAADADYTYYVFASSTKKGPYAEDNNSWESVFTSKLGGEIGLVGQVVSCTGQRPHVQHGAWATTKLGRDLIVGNDVLRCGTQSPRSVKVAAMELSDTFLDYGLNIAGMTMFQARIDWRETATHNCYEGKGPNFERLGAPAELVFVSPQPRRRRRVLHTRSGYCGYYSGGSCSCQTEDLTIALDVPATINSSVVLTLDGNASFVCDDYNMSAQWTVDPADFALPPGLVVDLPSYQLSPLASYLFTLHVSAMHEGSTVFKTASAMVTVVKNAPIAMIAGERALTWGMQNSWEVSAVGSGDYDYADILTNIVFSWTCEVLPIGATCPDDVILANTSTLAVSAGAMAEGAWVLSVVVSNGLASATSSVDVTITSGVLPQVTISVKPMVAPNVKIIIMAQLLAVDPSGPAVAYSWMIDSAPVVAASLRSPVSSPTIIVAPNMLARGPHSVRVEVLQGNNSHAAGAVFTVAAPPAGCVCSVAPASGMAVDTEFSLDCTDCFADSLPMTYAYVLDEIDDVPISDESVESNTTTFLPEGTHSIVALVTDAVGSLIRVPVGPVEVSPLAPPASPETFVSTKIAQAGTIQQVCGALRAIAISATRTSVWSSAEVLSTRKAILANFNTIDSASLAQRSSVLREVVAPIADGWDVELEDAALWSLLTVVASLPSSGLVDSIAKRFLKTIESIGASVSNNNIRRSARPCDSDALDAGRGEQISSALDAVVAAVTADCWDDAHVVEGSSSSLAVRALPLHSLRGSVLSFRSIVVDVPSSFLSTSTLTDDTCVTLRGTSVANDVRAHAKCTNDTLGAAVTATPLVSLSVWAAGALVDVVAEVEDIAITFPVQEDVSDHSCEFWDTSAAQWDSSGCRVLELDTVANRIKCGCDHLTQFSAQALIIEPGCTISNCTTCANSTCTNCTAGLFVNINGTACVEACPRGSYATAEGACVACSTGCATCSADECSRCEDHLILSSAGARCLPSCPEGETGTPGVTLQCAAVELAPPQTEEEEDKAWYLYFDRWGIPFYVVVIVAAVVLLLLIIACAMICKPSSKKLPPVDDHADDEGAEDRAVEAGGDGAVKPPDDDDVAPLPPRDDVVEMDELQDKSSEAAANRAAAAQQKGGVTEAREREDRRDDDVAAAASLAHVDDDMPEQHLDVAMEDIRLKDDDDDKSGYSEDHLMDDKNDSKYTDFTYGTTDDGSVHQWRERSLDIVQAPMDVNGDYTEWTTDSSGTIAEEHVEFAHGGALTPRDQLAGV